MLLRVLILAFKGFKGRPLNLHQPSSYSIGTATHHFTIITLHCNTNVNDMNLLVLIIRNCADH